MKYPSFQPQKNDVFFAFLLAAVFTMTVAGEVAGVVNVARGGASVEVANARQALPAPCSNTERAPLIAQAGAGR